MTRTHPLSGHIPPSFRHATAKEYATFLDEYVTSASHRKALGLYRGRFMRCYPDLRKWFEAPLPERVGRLYGEDLHHLSGHISYHARPYLMFLALCGKIQFDWEWLLALPRVYIWHRPDHMGLNETVAQLVEEAVGLGYERKTCDAALHWIVGRLFLHTADPEIGHIHEPLLAEMEEAVRAFGERPDVALYYGSIERYRRTIREYTGALHLLRVLLYHRGQLGKEPRVSRQKPPRPPIKPSMEKVMMRYLTALRLTYQPGTVKKTDHALRQLISWLAHTYPDVESFAEVTRDHLMEVAESLDSSPLTGRALARNSKLGILVRLAVFFQDGARWGWQDVPDRPLLQAGDLPKPPYRVPRYIPDHELTRLMDAIRTLDCPYQRTALLIARWSGARRDEIRRLPFDCLDSYPDGMPRLRIPAGKKKRARIIPLNKEAAEAIKVLQSNRRGERGFRDRLTGIPTRYLFVARGRLLSAVYLLDNGLQKACTEAGLVTAGGKPTVTPHRFRHTVGTQLAEKGAKLHTIMKILGHESASMSLVYAQISDPEVRKDYEAVLGPGATIAGPCAEALRSGNLSPTDINWLRNNFLKTELELGRCLRLPQEGPCECELYLTCAKFVTTPDYVPRLRRRRRIEQELVEDAAAHGWQREIERHQCTIRRLEQLLTDLGEPIAGPEAPN